MHFKVVGVAGCQVQGAVFVFVIGGGESENQLTLLQLHLHVAVVDNPIFIVIVIRSSFVHAGGQGVAGGRAVKPHGFPQHAGHIISGCVSFLRRGCVFHCLVKSHKADVSVRVHNVLAENQFDVRVGIGTASVVVGKAGKFLRHRGRNGVLRVGGQLVRCLLIVAGGIHRHIVNIIGGLHG